YERLRITWELTREIGIERDLDKLLEKILLALFKFVNADRGVILLKDEQQDLQPRAARRRDGTDAPIQVSSTILNHVIKEQKIVNRERFSRLLSPNIAEQVMSGKLEVKKGGQLVPECTVFNSDIRGFTRMSEGTTAEVMVDMLNEYFEEMVATIFKYEGTL